MIGKIAVLKSLVASQLVYVLSPLRTNAKAIKEVNKLFYSFFWNEKGDKIKRNVIINVYSKGGLKVIDVESFNKSLKTTLIKRYLYKNNQGKWKLFFHLDLESFGGTAVLTGNLNTNDINKIYKINNSFIKEVLIFWTEVNFKNQIISENQFLNQSLWHNSLIRVRPLFFPEWHEKGIIQVKNLKDDSNNYLTALQEKYSLISCL